VDLADLDALASAWRDETKLVWVETPTNPLLTVVDIAGAAKLAHDRGARVVVDNTFATPYLQQPLGLGADVTLHSSTKYLGGHSGHDVARRQMQDYGGMVSFTVAAGEEAAIKLVASTRLFTLAESLGAVESLIEHPAEMTHASAAGSPLAVDPALVRLSVGIESAEDLVFDLRQALDAVG